MTPDNGLLMNFLGLEQSEYSIDRGVLEEALQKNTEGLIHACVEDANNHWLSSKKRVRAIMVIASINALTMGKD